MKIKENLSNILRDINSENKRKIFLIYFFTSTALLSLLAFGVKGFSDGRITYSIIISVFFILAFANLIILKFFNKIKLSAHIVLLLMFMLELALFCSLGAGTTGLFWYYVFPPLAITLLDNKKGTIYSVILIAVTFIILAVKPDFLTNTYPKDIIIRFISTYFVVSILINIFEYSRNVAHKAYLSNLLEIKEKNEELIAAEEELRQNNEELMVLNENIQSQKDIIESKNKELQKYFTAIEHSGVSIVFTDTSGNIEYANPHFSKLTGYTANEALGKNPRVLKSGKTPKETFTNLWETISGGQTWKGEFINRKKDKTEFWESATISPVKNTNGVITAYVAIKEDITALKQYEQELKEKNEELQNTEKELRQYIEEFQTIFEDLEQRKKELDKANKTLSSTNLELDTANKEILAGINYASLIQKSMLTSEDIINTYLSEYFLIFKPKEIVSGDFYYVNKIENHLIIAVADCTGHGVSGAFITMLGITYLHDTILRKETYSTNTVLEIVRERFKRTFKTFGSDSKNGMDIALCTLNLDTLVLQYSGANLPLWIVRNDNFIEYKPTRCPIGFYPVDIDFQQNEIQLEKNDTIYMFSDGIYDQLSDINFKKYQKNKFRTLILENTTLSMENQKQKIIENFENWKGVNYQTDDVTVLGFKI